MLYYNCIYFWNKVVFNTIFKKWVGYLFDLHFSFSAVLNWKLVHCINKGLFFNTASILGNTWECIGTIVLKKKVWRKWLHLFQVHTVSFMANNICTKALLSNPCSDNEGYIVLKAGVRNQNSKSINMLLLSVNAFAWGYSFFRNKNKIKNSPVEVRVFVTDLF